MRKSLCLIVIILICFPAGVRAQEEEEETPPWMENVTIKGRTTYLIPKGAKREIIGAQVVVEPPNEYTARRIYEMEASFEKRFKSFEEDFANLKQEIEDLKAALSEKGQLMADNSEIFVKLKSEVEELKKTLGMIGKIMASDVEEKPEESSPDAGVNTN